MGPAHDRRRSLLRDAFYSLTVGGVSFRDWVAALLDRRQVRDVGDSLLMSPSERQGR